MYQKQDILCSVQKRKKRNLDDFYIDRFIDNLETKYIHHLYLSKAKLH